MKKFLFIIGVLCLIACRHDAKLSDDRPVRHLEYAGLLDPDIDPLLVRHYDSFWLGDTVTQGVFSIVETNVISDNVYSEQLSYTEIGGVIYDGALTPGFAKNVIPGLNFSVNGQLIPYSDKYMRNILRTRGHTYPWGTNWDIRVENAFSTNFYVPKSLRLISPFVTMEQMYDLSIGSSLTISWNADEKNDKGIIIDVGAWIPNTNDREKYIELIKKGSSRYLAKDDGHATIPADAFSYLPKGMFALVTIHRGNFAYIPGNKPGDFYGLSAATSTNFKVMMVK